MHRLGQTRPVFVWRYVARGTIEERMLEMQVRQKSVCVGGGVELVTSNIACTPQLGSVWQWQRVLCFVGFVGSHQTWRHTFTHQPLACAF